MKLTDEDGYVNLTPSVLSRWDGCPALWHSLLEQPFRPSVATATGNGGHRTMAILASMNRPMDAWDHIPNMVSDSLRRAWTDIDLDRAMFEAQSHTLTETIREFAHSWEPPVSTRPLVEASAEIVHTERRLRLRGRLDALYPPEQLGSAALVVDWKFGRAALEPPTEPYETPLSVIGQAALARRRLNLRCSVQVRWIFLRSGAEDVWELTQSDLVEGWGRIVALAESVRHNDRSQHPGPQCERCRLAGCEHAERSGDAKGLGLLDGDDVAA